METKYYRAAKALGMDPARYLRELKAETGLSDRKLAHDLEMDSGVKLSQPEVWNWRMKK